MNGHIQRLQEAQKVYKKVQRHVQRHTVQELQFYPEHDKRQETPEYAAVHKKLTVTEDQPCIVCGVKNSDLARDGKGTVTAHNPYGARQMETHHRIIEWALKNAVDVDKFNNVLRVRLGRHSPDPVYKNPMTAQQIADWVDHHEDNLWVLCDVHHRARYLGIHEITYPIWSPLDLLKPDFEEWARGEIDRIKKMPKAEGGKQ
jgi:hypothetical protein